MAALYHGFKTSTTPGTAVPLATGTVPVPATWITFFPRVVSGTGNAGEVRIGGVPLAADSGAIPSGSGCPIRPGDASVAWPVQDYDLRSIFLDVNQSGDGVQFVWGLL